MARLNKSDEPPVSLLSFMSILGCTLGSLLLVLGSVVALSIGPGMKIIASIDPVRSRHDKIPDYLEWDGASVTIHPGKTKVPFSVPSTLLSPQEVAAIKSSFTEIQNTGSIMAALRQRQSHKLMFMIGDTEFGRLLQQVQLEMDRRYVVVVVRPSGFETFTQFRGLIEAGGIEIGYWPIGEYCDFSVEHSRAGKDSADKKI